ncbi:MAG: hypothetical protein HY265_08335 [Deltaproteobacteria bacterium]|nr:hypothetical protein [Deltaproteobacteria bacterium]
MSEKNQCYRCKYKIPKEICGSSQSPYYNQKIEPTNSCDYFLENPAQDYFNLGLAKSLEPETKVEAIHELETAIRLGLPEDDEMSARFLLGEAYALFGGEPDSQELSESINQMEKAVLMDSQGKYGYFSEPINRARLAKLDLGYVMKARSIQNKEGADDAISYIHQKLQLFDYLHSSPMLHLLLELGNHYAEKGNKELASVFYKKLLECEVRDPGDEGGWESETRQWAEDNLKLLEQPSATKSGCFIATAVYGATDAPEVMIFRGFRDDVLLEYSIGRKIISFYYLFSPYAAKLIGKSVFAKSLVRIMIFKPAMWLISYGKSKLTERGE